MQNIPLDLEDLRESFRSKIRLEHNRRMLGGFRLRILMETDKAFGEGMTNGPQQLSHYNFFSEMFLTFCNKLLQREGKQALPEDLFRQTTFGPDSSPYSWLIVILVRHTVKHLKHIKLWQELCHHAIGKCFQSSRSKLTHMNGLKALTGIVQHLPEAIFGSSCYWTILQFPIARDWIDQQQRSYVNASLKILRALVSSDSNGEYHHAEVYERLIQQGILKIMTEVLLKSTDEEIQILDWIIHLCEQPTYFEVVYETVVIPLMRHRLSDQTKSALCRLLRTVLLRCSTNEILHLQGMGAIDLIGQQIRNEVDVQPNMEVLVHMLNGLRNGSMAENDLETVFNGVMGIGLPEQLTIRFLYQELDRLQIQ